HGHVESRSDREGESARYLGEAWMTYLHFIPSDTKVREAESAFVIRLEIVREIGFRLAHADKSIFHNRSRRIGYTAGEAGVADGFLPGREAREAGENNEEHGLTAKHQSSGEYTWLTGEKTRVRPGEEEAETPTRRARRTLLTPGSEGTPRDIRR